MARKKRAPAKGKAKPRSKKGGGRKPARKRSVLRRAIYWMFVLCLWVGIAGAGGAAYVIMSVSGTNLYALPEKERGIVVLAANGEVLARRGAFQGDRVRLDELPAYLPQAVMAIEDRRYHSHFGVDVIGLVRAMYENLKAGRVVQGGSTITQQLAKNLFLKPERTLQRKMQEAVLALWLEYKYSKEEILQLYLNRVYFGGGAHGVEAAAKRFFAKSARDVTLAEAAVLAGVLKAPSRYTPTRSRKRAEDRAYVVLTAMVESGFITAREGQQAVNSPATAVRRRYVSARQYIVDWISDLVPDYVAATNTNIIVKTTIDLEAQAAAEATVRKRLREQGGKLNVTQAAMVTMTPRGEIRALIGGANYAKSQYNRAVQARRQPGSAFKPFVFLTALEHGYSPNSTANDAPFRYKNWRPKNYRDKYYGEVTLRQALARSLNSVAARLTVELGPGEVADRARRLGIRSKMTANATIALGTSEVGLIEIAGAYAPFANGGMGVVPHIISKIMTTSGTVIYERQGGGSGRVVTDRNVGAMNDMLSAVVREGTGRKAIIGQHPAAGKTGTSQGFKDAWFVGYTASYVTAVWVGNDNGSPTKKVTGGGLPAEIWHDVMAAVHAYLPAAPLPGDDSHEPQSIVDLLRDLSDSVFRDILGGNESEAESETRGRDIGSIIDEISESPR
jgi:penicillin-binding protein 1A